MLPGADQAGFFAVSEPVGDLFDGGLFEVVGEGGLAGGGGVAWQDVAAGVGDAGQQRGAGSEEHGERRNERDDAGAADKVF